MEQGTTMIQTSAVTTTPESTEGKTRYSLYTFSFLALIVGKFFANLGNSVYELALLWEMKVLTGSTVMMSTVAIATLVPMIVIGPISGVLVDRWPKRRVMIFADVLRALVVGCMSAAVFLDHAAPWMLIITAVLTSSFGTLYNPAISAMLPILVGKQQLQQANSVTQGTQVVTQILGPFLGALLLAHVSMGSAFTANAIGFIISVLSLLFVRPIEPKREFHPLSVNQVGVELKEGLQALLQIPAMRTIVPVALIANFLFAPFELILIQYCTNILHGGVQLFGTMGSFFAIGMLLGALLTGFIANKLRKGVVLSIALVIMSVPIFFMAFVRVPWIALVLAALFGLFNMTVNIVFMTMLQELIPQDKLGRVTGSIGMVFNGAQPLAQALGGFLLTVFSVPVLIATIGGLEVANAAVGASRKMVRELR